MSDRRLPVRRWLAILIPALMVLVLVAVILPGIQQARDAARRSNEKNNLKQLGLAFHNYHDSFKTLPPGAVVRADGLAMHGWCCSVMPYIDSSPLYNNIDTTVPWEHPRNRRVFRIEYPTFLMASVAETHTVEGDALTHFMANPNFLHRNSSVTLDDMTAGTGNSWLLGSAAGNYQPYGYQFNWRALTTLNSGPNSYGRHTNDGAHILIADGSVRFLNQAQDGRLLSQLANAPPIAKPDETAVPRKTFRCTTSGPSFQDVHLED